jgi:glycosyltransferase involved in cell wall biosynthesis
VKAPLQFSDLLLAGSDENSEVRPFITVAIPHFKQRRYLEIVLESLFAQTFTDFEIVVSDDGSPDDSNSVIPSLLQRSGCAFRYYAQLVNLGYDGNVRFCLSAARGRYVFLLGNDDALNGADCLGRIARSLTELGFPECAFTSYEDWGTGEVVHRALSTRTLGAGSLVALTNFRSFSFVSGLIYDRASAAQHESDRWDTSIYYQIYLGCRIIAAGGSLASLELSAVRKDVKVDDQAVPNHVSKWASEGWSLKSRHSGLESVIRVTVDAVLPFIPEGDRSATVRRIIARVLLTSYPFWLFEFRGVSNWSFAAGIARGMWPGGLLTEYDLTWSDRSYLWLLYLFVTAAALSIPRSLLGDVRHRIANSFRRQQQEQPAINNKPPVSGKANVVAIK